MAFVVPRGLNGPRSDSPDTAPGWSYNPSSWWQRTPIIILALVNFFLARYLAAYQLGHIDHAWDPMFSEGTHDVLTSDISEAFPISDAGLGAVAYMIEALIGCIGNAARWRTAPWAVALFGLLVVPVGVVSLVLIMLQPVVVGSWCFLCLVTALIMLIMAVLALPEVAALCWLMYRNWHEKRSLWRTFLFGDVVSNSTVQRPLTFQAQWHDIGQAMYSGATVPWNLLLCVALGAWQMAYSESRHLPDVVADAHAVTGALVLTVAVLSMAEPARALRFVNLLLAAGLMLVLLLHSNIPLGSMVHGIAIAAAIMILSMPRSSLKQSHGAWQRLVV